MKPGSAAPETDWDAVRTPLDDVAQSGVLTTHGIRGAADVVLCAADMAAAAPEGVGNSMQHELACIDLDAGLSAFDSV